MTGIPVKIKCRLTGKFDNELMVYPVKKDMVTNHAHLTDHQPSSEYTSLQEASCYGDKMIAAPDVT